MCVKVSKHVNFSQWVEPNFPYLEIRFLRFSPPVDQSKRGGLLKTVVEGRQFSESLCLILDECLTETLSKRLTHVARLKQVGYTV